MRRFQTYRYRVVMESDDGSYHVFVPSLPGCHTFGDTEDEALTIIREAVQVHVESLWTDKAAIPASDPEGDGMMAEAVIPWATT